MSLDLDALTALDVHVHVHVRTLIMKENAIRVLGLRRGSTSAPAT